MTDNSTQKNPGSTSGYFSGEAGRVLILRKVKCSNCGGAVEIPEGQEQVTCQFCGSRFDVDLVNPDFVIDRGVLTKYRGTSPEVVVPDHVTAISSAAFNSQDSLTKITFPAGLKEIHLSAFNACRGLENLVLPDGLEIISGSAFQSCEGLKSIVLPKNLKQLGSMPFYKCKSLVSIEIPPGIKTIERNAFSGCDSLETIILYEGTELCGHESKMNCPKLSKVIVLDPSTGEKVAEKHVAADEYGGLSETTVWEMSSEERAELAQRAAENMQQPEETSSAAPAGNSGEEIVIKSGVTKLDCSGCGGVIDITEDQDRAVCPYCGFTFTLSFESPDFVIDQGVLVKYAGKDREVIVPDGVRAIGLLAFYGQSLLTKIVLPNSVTELQGGFMGCRSLETLILSDNIEIIPDCAFQDCESLKTIVLPRNMWLMGQIAFANCNSLESIEIPARMNYLDKMTFCNCSNLQTIIRYEHTQLGGDDYIMCPKLSTLIILDDVTGEKIEERRIVFDEYGVHHTEVTVWVASERPSAGISAGGVSGVDGASDTSGAGAIEPQPAPAAEVPFDIPALFSVSSHESDSFPWPRDISCTGCGATIQVYEGQTLVNCKYCRSQFSVSIDSPDFIMEQGVLVKYVGKNREVMVPGDARIIGTLAFYQQSSLKKIVLPNSVTESGITSFFGCFGLETLVLSKNMRAFSFDALKDCIDLTTIVLPGNQSWKDSLALTRLGSLETIVCYKGARLPRNIIDKCRALSRIVILDPETGEKLKEERIP